MELISPLQPSAPWKYVWDMEGFTMFFPIDDTNVNREAYGCGQKTYFNLNRFAPRLRRAALYDGDLRKFTLFRTFVDHFMKVTILDQVASDILCHSLPLKERWSFQKELELPILNVLLYRYPLDFVNNLSICDKTAYLDTKENIDSILPYINDVSGKTFIKGEENGFLSSHYGIRGTGLRNNYFWTKLKVMISSGMYGYWKAWFKTSKSKREKLFYHYANWNGPLTLNVVKKT